MIRANGGTCVGYKVDISKKEEVYKAADAIRRDVGDVSVLYPYKLDGSKPLLCGKLGNDTLKLCKHLCTHARSSTDS